MTFRGLVLWLVSDNSRSNSHKMFNLDVVSTVFVFFKCISVSTRNLNCYTPGYKFKHSVCSAQVTMPCFLFVFS